MIKQYTNLELFNFITNITEDLMQKATGKVAYALTCNLRKIQNELKEYIKIRNDLIHKYSKELENGQVGIDMLSEEYEHFKKDIEQYDTIVQDINFIMLESKDLFDTNLSAEDMMQIEFMIGDANDV